MSGSSRVQFKSESFHLSSESPCMNCATHPDYPDQEQRYHQSWMERGTAWLERAKPVLEQRFASLAARPDPGLPLVKYDEAYPLWNSYRDPEQPPPWRVGFLGMSGPGSTEVVVAFSSLPTEEARERFKQLLIQDLAAAEAPKTESQPPPPPPPPDRRLLLRGALGILALALTFGFLRVILPNYGETAGLLVNLGCWLVLYVAWNQVFRVPTGLSRVKVALLLTAVPLVAAGHWNVMRVEKNLQKEIVAHLVQRLGVDWTGEPARPVSPEEFPVLVKQVEDRHPGWPRALHRLMGPVDAGRSPDDHYGEPSALGARQRSGPLGLTHLSALRVSLREEQRLLALAETDRDQFLSSRKKQEAGEK